MWNQRFDLDRIPKEELELEHSGHLACPGCGAALAMRLALKALGPDVILVIPACCWSIIAGPYPQSSLGVPVFHTAFETAAAVASGVKRALHAKGNDHTLVMAWAGDGGTFDIGFQALSGAAERNEDILYVCYDNEAYMNTGIQRSGGTPRGAWTTTTPSSTPKEEPKKPIADIVAAHRVPYVAASCVSYPDDFFAKVQKAKEIKGFRFLHVLSSCPPGWKIPERRSLEIARLAVESRVFPLFEIFHGEERHLTYTPKKYVPVADYLSTQGRFRHLSAPEISGIQKEVDHLWTRWETK